MVRVDEKSSISSQPESHRISVAPQPPHVVVVGHDSLGVSPQVHTFPMNPFATSIVCFTSDSQSPRLLWQLTSLLFHLSRRFQNHVILAYVWHFDHRCFGAKALTFVMLGVLFTSSFTTGTSGEPAALGKETATKTAVSNAWFFFKPSTQQPTLHPPILPRSIKSWANGWSGSVLWSCVQIMSHQKLQIQNSLASGYWKRGR